MTDTQLLTLSAQLVATLFGTLIAVLAWMGNKLYNKLESISQFFDELRRDIHLIDARVTRLEERCRYEHDARAQ